MKSNSKTGGQANDIQRSRKADLESDVAAMGFKNLGETLVTLYNISHLLTLVNINEL